MLIGIPFTRFVYNDMTDTELFEVMSSMLFQLNDGHVSLQSPFKKIYSNEAQKNRRTENFNINDVLQYYVPQFNSIEGNHFFYGAIGSDVGYVWIPTFEDEDFASVDQWTKGIDKVVKVLKDRKGIIVDIRNNGGGDAFNAQAIAGRFADQKRLFAYGYSRDGRKHGDFSKPYDWYVEPTGSNQFTKTIVVLTNKNTASGAERFELAMKTLPYVTVVGDTTEGAFPHALPRTLPNGWVYRVTVGVVEPWDHAVYEGLGIPPDQRITITPTDASHHKDTILEYAIAYIQNNL